MEKPHDSHDTHHSSSPPPPPPPSSGKPPPTTPSRAGPAEVPPPVVAATGPVGAHLVELFQYSGGIFLKHWAFWIPTPHNPNLGMMIHAAGDVTNGFRLEIKRGHDLSVTGNFPLSRTPLQWVDGQFLNDPNMFIRVPPAQMTVAVGGFEQTCFSVPAPQASLNDANAPPVGQPGKNPVRQRNCQTWITEAAAALVNHHIFAQATLTYLNAIKPAGVQ